MKLSTNASKIGYPVIIKATAGGGGKGMRICWDKDELKSNFDLAKNEAMVNFGNGDVYIEKYIEEPHHVEVQILGDHEGSMSFTWANANAPFKDHIKN